MEEMAEDYEEPEFEKLRKAGGVIPPKKRSVKRMMWDRALTCFAAPCIYSPPPAFRTQKQEEEEEEEKKMKMVAPPPTKRIVPLPN
ncbi:hypothetical protein ACJRO7_024425 [Eucalyptus globulus]|uniref:Uncharacterized protein n=1 Tax=Eucalyptus globulus TaxID=34317 RepID=A0ABD3KBE2_EUCGL